MSRYDRSNLDQRQSHGLPGEEYRSLRRAQDRDRLETHFEHCGNVKTSYAAPRSAYRDAGLSQSECYRVSEVRSATRATLGGSFEFDDEGYERSRRRESEYQRSRGWNDDEPSCELIPKKYLDEFNKKWHEDDEDNDANQYLADFAREAPWRKHILPEYNRVYVEPLHTRLPRTSAASSRADSGYASSDYRRSLAPPSQQPPLTSSKFSFDDREELLRRHRYANYFRHQ